MTASSSSIERSKAADPTKRIGRYEVLGELASGGTGTVYLARLDGLGGFARLYAIKLIHKHLSTRPEIVEMMRKEAHLASQVHHPNVVDMFEVSVTEDGRHYLVMGYVEGASLDDLFAHPKLDAIRRVRLGIAILLDAMSGLDAVHRATDAMSGEPLGIVHCDMSPANILIGIDGVCRIADFGIASARAHKAVSEPGVVRGTPRYMAPEQATGLGPIDARSDVFGLGAVLWEVITGEPLFDSHVSVEDILQQVVSATIPPPSDRNSRMPETVDAVCLRALQRDPAERYASVAEFRAALAQVAGANGLIASPPELVDELSSLFADRITHRRALAAQAARRSSGTQLRAVVVSADKAAISQTQIGIQPLRDVVVPAADKPSGEVDIRATLDDLLGRDEEEDDEKVDIEGAPDFVPKRHWRRWAVLALLLVLGGAGWLGYRALGVHAPATVIALPRPKLNAPMPQVAAAPEPAPVPMPLPPEEVAAHELRPAAVLAAEPAPQSRAPLTRKAPIKRAVERAPIRPPPVVAAAAPVEADPIAGPGLVAEPAEPVDRADSLPLETNPYRLRR